MYVLKCARTIASSCSGGTRSCSKTMEKQKTGAFFLLSPRSFVSPCAASFGRLQLRLPSTRNLARGGRCIRSVRVGAKSQGDYEFSSRLIVSGPRAQHRRVRRTSSLDSGEPTNSFSPTKCGPRRAVLVCGLHVS